MVTGAYRPRNPTATPFYQCVQAHSNVSRGERRKAQGDNLPSIGECSEVAPSGAKRAWAWLIIRQVYEADPPVYPRCAGPMRIIAFIEHPAIIAKILTPLGLRPALAHSPPARALAA
jgi:hypothetical protein